MVVIALEEELDRLESADITGNEAEDGDTDTALDEDSEEGELEEHGGFVFGGRGPQQVRKPSGCNVFNNDEGGSNATEALRISS